MRFNEQSKKETNKILFQKNPKKKNYTRQRLSESVIIVKGVCIYIIIYVYILVYIYALQASANILATHQKHFR